MNGLHFSFANGQQTSSTLRELRQLATNWGTWRILALVSLVVGLIGPFGTFGSFGLIERLIYWSLLVVGSFYVVTFSLGLSDRWLEKRVRSKLGVATVGALMAAVPVSMLILGIGYPFGMTGVASDLPEIYANAAVVTVGVSLLFLLLGETPQTAVESVRPSILQRLPVERRGALVRMSVNDHYVEVVTTGGRSLVLMRLRDAIGETEPTAGLRVHRSHWVAVDGVTGHRRENGRVVLTTRDGFAVPISRSHMKDARDAGLVS